MGSLFLWWLILLIAGWAAYPIAFTLLNRLPDRGYLFSKVLALLLTGYLSWIMGYASFGTPVILTAFFMMLALSLALLWIWIKGPFFDFVKGNLGFFVVFELLFFAAFLVAGAYKMRTYGIVGQEKPMDFTFVNGILASSTMPPQDPWLAGGSISYYYFGYLIVAALTKVSGVPSGEAYNLAVALIWALSWACAFSLAYALTRKYRYSFFSASSMVLLGNLDYWHRAVQSFQIGNLRIPYYNDMNNYGTVAGFKGFFGFLISPLQHGWDFFQASRIIVPPAEKLINEFPSFSFFLSDLHPHVMAIPFVLLALAMAFNLLKASGRHVFGQGIARRALYWTLYAIAFGGLGFLNSWDFPTYTFLLGLCLFLQQWWEHPEDFGDWFKSVTLIGVPVLLGAFALYLPFYSKLQSQAQGLGIVGLDRTGLYHFFIIFGLFLAILLPAMAGRAFRRGSDKNTRSKTKSSEEPVCEVCGKEGSSKKRFCGYCGGQMVVVGDVEIYAAPDENLRQSFGKISSLLSGGLGSFQGLIFPASVLFVLALGSLFPGNLAVLFLALVILLLIVLSVATRMESKEMIFSTLAAGLGFLLIAWCEVFYVKDLFAGNLYRMNTVFKFHYQVWILLSVASGPFLKWVVENQWPRWAIWKKAAWACLLAFTLFGASLYPVLTLISKMRGASNDDTVTLDGAVYYERSFPMDYQAARWISDNVKPVGGKSPIILEAWGDSYMTTLLTSGGRVATLTGYPTVLGWAWHEVQWRGSGDKTVIRGGRPDDTIQQRKDDVDAIYTSSDINQTRGLLKKYGIDYVYVGDVERLKYKDHADSLNKFFQLGAVAWQMGTSDLYKVNP